MEKQELSENEWDESQELLEDFSAYVLVTCGKPSADGKMTVEMTYEGDPSVISYLLTQAKDSLE